MSWTEVSRINSDFAKVPLDKLIKQNNSSIISNVNAINLEIQKIASTIKKLHVNKHEKTVRLNGTGYDFPTEFFSVSGISGRLASAKLHCKGIDNAHNYRVIADGATTYLNNSRFEELGSHNAIIHFENIDIYFKNGFTFMGYISSGLSIEKVVTFTIEYYT